MIATCEGCGKKYRIDPDKIKGDSARFKCRSCGQVVTVQRTPGGAAAAPPPPPPAPEPSPAAPPAAPAAPEPAAPAAKKKPKKEKLKLEGLSIRSKITMIIVTLVIVSLAVSGFIATFQSRDALSKQAEDHLTKNARLKSREYALTFERIKEEVQALIFPEKSLEVEISREDQFIGSCPVSPDPAP